MNVHDLPIWRDMLSGQVYEATHPLLIEELNRVKDLLADYNAIRPSNLAALEVAIKQILGRTGKNIKVLQPFRCDFGRNIRVGENFFANFNLTILDEGLVTIGDNVFIGPNVSIYTACHDTDPQERNSGREWNEAVTIGNDVWIGGSVTILPGVTIGDGVTIGAGSVVTRDVPSRVVAAGNPARIIRTL